MTDAIDIAALSGVEQLRLGLTGGFVAPIARSVGFELVEIEEGRVVFEGVPTTAFYNPLGTVHGGWMATLLDSACGCVVHSMLRPGQTYTTLELKTVFHKALTAGVPVRAEGRIVQMGSRAGFAEADLRGVDGKLYATATSTCLVMAR
ncbi:MAG: thioesterase [Brevundimonas sp.]|uniref:PaaI family thioesterase n=1 Tax=Brevundimonas sp. TaxID=1871086 RepID=UPI000DB29563|nr:PaaI family thioesterase [Brevundimonas sp.]PZU74894.1 MAG: thioesterase [Brevundimonas sp.]